MIAVLAALERELNPVAARLEGKEEVSLNGEKGWTGCLAGRRVAAVLTGVGPERARRAAETVLAGLAPRLVLSIGYAGGLDPALSPAELVLAEGAIRGASRVAMHPQALAQAERILRAAGAAYRRGWLLTVDEPLATPESKADAHRRWGAAAVEMETAEVAAAAREAGIPCLALRAISDAADQRLRVAGRCVLSRRGVASFARLAARLASRPGEIVHAWRLHRQGGDCSRRLADAVDAICSNITLE